MIEVVPFKAAHLAAIKLQDTQVSVSEWVTESMGVALEEHNSYTGFYEGNPIGAAGIIHQWPGRSLAWAFIGDAGPSVFIQIHHAVKRFLDGCYVKRLEMTVDCEFPEGHRWAKLLGFKMECERMRQYTPDGRDNALYVRILQ